MGITSTGYETTPKATIKTEVQKIFTDALGEDLDLSEETPQGNLINGLTDLLHQIDMHRQSDFYARDLYKAVGTQLDIIGRELGIVRKDSVPTQVLVTLLGAVNYKIPAGTLVNVTTNSTQVFQFTSDVEITSSSIQVTLTATDGSVYEDLQEGQQLQTQEYIPQIYDITINSIIYGQAAESDYVYRARLIDAKSANTDEVEHFTLELENINNVLSAYVEPNNSLNISPSGIPPHAVEIVVLGGSETEIGQVLMANLFATPTYQHPTLSEEISVLDYNDHLQTFYITRPEMRNITVDIHYENKPKQSLTTADINTITDKIKELINSTYMNKTLYVSDLYNLATEGFTQVYAIQAIDVKIDGLSIIDSYTCTSREYMYATGINFVDSEESES